MRFSDPGGAQPPTRGTDPPASSGGSQVPEILEAGKATWARPEAENYSDDSIYTLTTFVLKENEANGGDLFTRQNTPELATIRAT